MKIKNPYSEKFTNPNNAFCAAPEIHGDNRSFQYILECLSSDQKFFFCKINHGFWERLARLEELGVSRSVFTEQTDRTLDDMLGIGGSMFAEGGLLADLLLRIKTLPSPNAGMNFVASLAPWPDADRIEGTPYQRRAVCNSIIKHFVPQAHLLNIEDKRFTGNEFKVAAITGDLRHLLNLLHDRDVILVANKDNRALLDAAGVCSLKVVQVHPQEARLKRDCIRAELFDALEAGRRSARPPIVIAAAGGALSSWLGFQVWDNFSHVHFVDLGGTLAAYSPGTAMVVRWTQAYRRQLAKAIPAMGIDLPIVTSIYTGKYGLRDPALVNIACEAGVPAPRSTDILAAPVPETTIPFIENKVYDHQRMFELLSLSINANHHANGGPVSTLLESIVANIARLPTDRRVIAVSSGTAALHMACGLHELTTENRNFRWVTSAFTFFSAHVGPKADSIVIDCDMRGRMNVDALQALPLDSYDGVIYTNVFAQFPDWDDIADYCKRHGKRLVVDNANGLLDRPESALRSGAHIEIVSAHHTKPWGVGEGGFIFCDAGDEETLRQLANYGARLSPGAAFAASNYKLSDLAAAAIINRLELQPWWGRFYEWQERRMHSIMIDAGQDIMAFNGSEIPRSPRAHTPFLCTHSVDVTSASGPATLRKYYKPLATSKVTPNADGIFARIFSLSNAPEMRLASNDEIISQVRRMIEKSATNF